MTKRRILLWVCIFCMLFCSLGSGAFASAEGTTGTPAENESVIYQFLKEEMNLSTAAACGILANIYYESGFRPDAVGSGGKSYGICQWYSGRWERMKEWCNDNGCDWETLEGQLQYLKFELSENNGAYLWNGRTIYEKLLSVPDTSKGAYLAGYLWCHSYEIPAKKETVAVSRGNFARYTYWPKYSGELLPSETVVNPFMDVTKGDFYYEPVLWAADAGITDGITPELFAPMSVCTRAEVVTFLWRAEGCPEASVESVDFVDINPEDFYYEALLWASEAGIVNGMDPTHFVPFGQVTRGQVVTYLHRAMGEPEYRTKNPFTDIWEDSYDYAPILWALEDGVTTGITSSTFLPNQTCTRGEIVTFLYRAFDD